MKGFIDMQRATFLYGAGVVALMLLSLLISNVPALQLSQYAQLALRRELAAAFAVAGALFGIATMLRHMDRTREPYRIPQSQVAARYLGFFFCNLVAVLLAK